MPHQCTDCGRTFEDGSKEMLSGCPDCGGNKFQFHPDGVDADGTASEEPPEPPEPAVDSSVARTVGNAATAVRDLVGGGSSPPDPPEVDSGHPEAESEPSADRIGGEPSTGDPSTVEPESGGTAKAENDAQASARSEIVSPDDLPASSRDSASGSRTGPMPTTGATPGDRPTVHDGTDGSDERSAERPDLSELREELNQQFESIRVLEPGQYELNLMELFDREEYIIALQEDGKYTIQVPDRWED